MEGGGRRGEGDEKRLKMCYLHVPTPNKECNHYVLQTCANKNIFNLKKLLLIQSLRCSHCHVWQLVLIPDGSGPELFAFKPSDLVSASRWFLTCPICGSFFMSSHTALGDFRSVAKEVGIPEGCSVHTSGLGQFQPC